MSVLTLDKIYHAKFVLKQVARKTDLIAAPHLCPGTELYLKTENAAHRQFQAARGVL